MITRKLGKLVRGKATPFQIVSASLLGALIGGAPGFLQAPLWGLLLFFALLVINANLFVAAASFLLVKLLTLLLLPVYFHVGAWLLEGPLNGLVAAVANAPVAAWFGWEYYATVPALLGSLVFGLALGAGLTRGLRALRRKLGAMEAGSERYQRFTAKKWVKALAWVFFGGLKGKGDWAELAENKRGRPVRLTGLAAVAGLAVLLAVGLQFLDTTIVTAALRERLERANGATVDIDGVEIDAAENRVTVRGLAMADPAELGQNRFAADALVADVSGMDLLARKWVVDRIEAKNAATSAPRRVPGRRVGKPPAEAPPDEPPPDDVKSVDDYLEQGAVWRERLETLQRVYDMISGRGGKKADKRKGESTWRERLERQAAMRGYWQVKSDSVLRDRPRLVVRELAAENIEVGGSDARFDLVGANISTQPGLLPGERGRIELAGSDGAFRLGMTLPNAADPATTGLKLRYEDIPVDRLAAQTGGRMPLSGGRMTVSGEGSIVAGNLRLPVEALLHDTTLAMGGKSVPLDGVAVPVEVTGTLGAPRLDFPDDFFQSALKGAAVDAGKKKVQEKVKGFLKGLGE